MFIPIQIGALIAAGLACAFAVVFRFLTSPSRCELVSSEWLSRFSVARYRPLGRLLSQDDYRFLEQQKGYHPRIARRLRRERVKVFRAYLHCISSDFRRLEAAINLCMVSAPQDRPELASALLIRRFHFACALALAQWRLLLYRLGLGSVDVRDLVSSLDGMRSQLGHMALVRQGL